MAKIPEDVVRHIQDIAKIEDVVGEFVKLRKTGVNLTGICPFHDDRHDGNFIVRPSRIADKDGGNTYRCFVCDAKGGPVTFLMEHEHLSFPDAIRWLGKKYNEPVDDIPLNYTPPPPRPTPPPLPTLVLPRKMVAERIDNRGDVFCNYVRQDIKWSEEQRARVEDVLRLYCVGHAAVKQRNCEHHFTVFWQVDKDGNPRTAHYMKYKTNGHRMKKEDSPYNTDWLHSLLIRRRDPQTGETTYDPPYPYPSIYNPDTQEARQCLFGEHLMNRYPNAPVCIVESEKTAILMAIAYGNNPMQLWMACCGSSNITRERLKPLINQRRRIILYPDHDGVKLWKQKMDALYYDRIEIDTRPVLDWWQPDDGEKADIADVVLRMINSHPTDLAKGNNTVKKLITTLDLQET